MYLPIEKRQFYGGGYYYGGNSAWYNWGRWVLFGAIILIAVLFFIVFSCISARRRRKAGYQPYRFTGWAANHGTPMYNPNAAGTQMNDRPPPGATQQPYYNNNMPPPAYGQNQGYYGETGVTQPPQAHAGHYKPQGPGYSS